MRPILLAMILTFVGPLAPALAAHTHESIDADTGYVTVAHSHRQTEPPSTTPPPAHAAFRYRKGGLCHHYHYYKPTHPDC